MANGNLRPWVIALLAVASTAVAVGIAWGTLGGSVDQALQGCAENAGDIDVLEGRTRELEQTMRTVETDVRWIRETLERQYGE